MIDITPYLSKDATLKTPVGVNQYGEPSYSEETIRVRWEPSGGFRRDPQGVQVTSDTMLLTNGNVSVGDAVIDLTDTQWTVTKVDERYDLEGDIVHREVYF